MFPGEFDYYRAESVEGAIDLLSDHAGAETAVLAGGHSLVPAMKAGDASPDVVVDVGGIDDLSGVAVDDGTLTIGATTRYVDLLESAAVAEHAPAVADAVPELADLQIRNRGTIGGNLVAADPGADLPGAALAAGATLVVRGPDGRREVGVDEFVRREGDRALGDAEVLTRVEVPAAGDGTVGAYAKKTSPTSGYALVGVAVRLEFRGDRITSAGVGANGALDRGIRLEAVEDALEGGPPDEDRVEAAADRATEGLDPDAFRSDVDASGEFRAHLLSVFVRRAIREAASRRPAAAGSD